MNVYQKILVKLFKVSGGKITEAVDLKELVKSEGFHPSYKDIFRQLSQQGWIAETGRADVVNITHWGVKEAKKLSAGGVDDSREIEKKVNRLKAEVKEFMVMTEEFAGDISEEHFGLVVKQFGKVRESIEELKGKI